MLFYGPSKDECPKCGIFFKSYERFKQHGPHPVHEVPQAAPLALDEDEVDAESLQRISFRDRKINLIVLPAAFVFAAMSKFLVFPGMVLWYFFSIPIHELGHAFSAWMGSRFAVPIGAFIPMAAFTAAGHSVFLLVSQKPNVQT